MQDCLPISSIRLLSSQTDQQLADQPPLGLARYKLIRSLGTGGMAEVMLCLDEVLNRQVAVKVLRNPGGNHGSEEIRFLREARVLAALRHPSIPVIHDLGRDANGCPYIVTDVLEGICLRSILSGLRRNDVGIECQFPLERLLQIMISLCEAAEFAHRHGVIHRDIKPEHVHIASGDRVTLLDWGLAKLMSDCDSLASVPQSPRGHESVVVCTSGNATEDARLTQHGQLPGTPLYMSPEQVQGSFQLDQRTDVYSIGAVLYDCLVLDTLVSGSSVGEIFRSILAGAIRRPSLATRRRNLNAELERVCMKAVSQNPQDRYPSAAALGSDLRECQLTLLTEFERNLDRVSTFNFGVPSALAPTKSPSPAQPLSTSTDCDDRRSKCTIENELAALAGLATVDPPVPFGYRGPQQATGKPAKHGNKWARAVRRALGRKRS